MALESNNLTSPSGASYSKYMTDYYSIVSQLENVRTSENLSNVLASLRRLFAQCPGLADDVDVLELKASLEGIRAAYPLIWEDKVVQDHGKLLRIISKAQDGYTEVSSPCRRPSLPSSEIDSRLAMLAREDSRLHLLIEVYGNGCSSSTWAIFAITTFLCFHLVIPLGLSIALLIIGSISKEPKCDQPLESWCLAVGSFGISTAVIGFINKMLSGVDKTGRRRRGPLTCFVWILHFAVFILVIMGCVFTYSINRSAVLPNSDKSRCNYLLFWFCWYLLTICLSGMGIGLLGSCIYANCKGRCKSLVDNNDENLTVRVKESSENE